MRRLRKLFSDLPQLLGWLIVLALCVVLWFAVIEAVMAVRS